MKKKIVYVVPCQDNVNFYDFTANRFLFKALKSCGVDGYFSMNATNIPEWDKTDCNCSPISLGG
tara:strand:+ start:445 stop:636 length:192 start_codon:yes stop_codon:yes gene_type:complete